MKKLISLFILLILSTFVVKAYDFSYTYQGKTLYYNITSNTDYTASITSQGQANYVSGAVEIPSSVTYNGNTYSVTSIDTNAFQNCSGLTSVTVPNSITSFNQGAFHNCTCLASITIPNSVTYIGVNAFVDCTGLIIDTIPNSVTSIGASAFNSCTSLTNITIPNSVTYIGDNAFYGCTNLTNITIPNSVTSIGRGTFNGCTSLTSIIIPNTVTSIGEMAFLACTSLANIIIGNSVTSIGPEAFVGCTSLTSITIPNSVTVIDEFAFDGCSGLTNVIIGDSVTSIGYSAFGFCTSLTSVTIGKSVTSIYDDAFNACCNLDTMISLNTTPPTANDAFPSCFSNCDLFVPCVAVSNYQSSTSWNVFNIINVLCTVDSITATIFNNQSYDFNGTTLNIAGIYRDTLQSISGCYDSVIVLTLNVNPLSVKTMDTTLCYGETLTFNGTTYTSTNTYTTTVTGTNGDCDTLYTINLTILPQNVASETITVCYGESATFNGQTLTEGENQITVQGTNGDCDTLFTVTLVVREENTPINEEVTLSSSEFPYTYHGETYTAYGSYSVTEEDEYGCDQVYNLTLVANSGIEEIAEGLTISLYPNPTKANATLKVNGLNEQATIIITDQQGRVISSKVLPAGVDTMEVETDNLASGVYYIRVQTANTIRTEKLIKQ